VRRGFRVIVECFNEEALGVTIMNLVSMFAGLALLPFALAAPAQGRITRIEIVKVEPAFDGQSFGAAGPFEHVIGRAHGEVDPGLPENGMIQDILLAPRNIRGMVEYTTDIDILRPADPTKSNKILLFDVINRGRKVALFLFNAGDGWLQRQGYTLIWFGWQADVLAGDGRMTLSVPIARNGDGTPITASSALNSSPHCRLRPRSVYRAAGLPPTSGFPA
jgi:hypothetical protein